MYYSIINVNKFLLLIKFNGTQEYSSNIEPFYHSENEMTDDDLDVDIVESTYTLNETLINRNLSIFF